MRGKRSPAFLENFGSSAFNGGGVVRIVALRYEHDLGRDDRPHDRVLSRRHERHAYTGVPIDHGLDFLGMDLQAPDVDDPPAAPDKVVAVAAALDDVTGIDEAFGIEQRLIVRAEIAQGGAFRLDSEGVILDPEMNS